MENNSLILSTAKSFLPAFNANGVTYNDIAKMFLTPAWCSIVGNAYQEGLRLSNKIAVTYSIGHGHTHSFLNGIRIFRYEDGKPVLIGERGFSSCFWNDYSVNNETVNLLTDCLESQCRVLGLGTPDMDYVRQVAATFVEETIKGTKLLGM